MHADFYMSIRRKPFPFLVPESLTSCREPGGDIPEVLGDSFLFNAIQEKIRKISRSVDMGGQLCEKRNERLSTFIHSTNKNSEEWAQEKRRDRNCN